MNLQQLRLKAKEYNFKGYSSMRKADLLLVLTEFENSSAQHEEEGNDIVDDDPASQTEASYSKMDNKTLKLLCKQRGLKHYSKLDKASLVGMLNGEQPVTGDAEIPTPSEA